MTRICKQIGIVDRVDLVFSRKEMNDRCAIRSSAGSRRAVGTQTLGTCSIADRAVFVNETGPREGYTWIKVHMKRKYSHKWIKEKWNYSSQKKTLVHELCHYRWPYLNDGTYALEERIRQVIRGRTFPPKHVGLSGGYRRPNGKRRLIDCNDAII